MTTTLAIDVQGLKKHVRTGFWGTRRDLLHDVSLAVPTGSIFGFVGPNGAGKSTTIKTIIGAAVPGAGTVRVLGGSSHDPQVRARLGYLPELPQLPATLSPDEVIDLHGRLIGLPTDVSRTRKRALLERVGLFDRRRDRIGTFSKGMQQRVALALALLGEPELLILDEPMSGLDPLGRRLVRELILEQHARGATVFFSSHVLPDVEALCSHVAVLYEGSLVEQGAIDDVLETKSSTLEILVRGEGLTVDALGKLGSVVVRGDAFAITLAGDTAVGEAVSTLVGMGALVLHVESQRPNLEDQVVGMLARAGMSSVAKEAA